jgi:hypothetical protein
MAIAAVVAALATLASGSDRRNSAFAQASPAGLVANGNAVVTGFSGAQPPAVIAPGVDPADKTFIDLQGPAARVFDLQAPGELPQTQLLTAPKPFTVTADQVGQVFGVALDSAAQPNVFVAATSVYGLPIVVPAGGGQAVRVKQGAPNAAFMAGLFGPAPLGGGPGSIWRIDGTTGEVRLFANVALDGAANPGPALGGLAFDSASNTLFVADRATGMIHAFDSSGKERGRYDHGVQGRVAAGLQPVPYNPAGRLDISKPKFRTGDPATWGYAAPERLIFGLGVRTGRLYYAVARDLQIWSVAIAPEFGADPRLEITAAPGPGPSEISKITFDDQGRMLLAERAAPSGAADFMALTVEATGRVLRYLPVPPGTPGPQWQEQSDEYAIGFARQMRNGNGGVAVGFGYDEQGRIDRAACGQFLWSTGEQLRNAIDPAIAALLAAGGPAEVNGLQGNEITAVVPANTPPFHSYFADYDDQFGDPQARSHVGDIAIPRICGQTGINLPGWYRQRVELMPGFFWFRGHGRKPPMLDCPPGSGNQCACPPGTTQQLGFQCCQIAFTLGADGQCKSPCPDGSSDSASVEMCWQGFAPHPANINDPSSWTCQDGSTPTKDANGYHCPLFKMPVCPAGYQSDPSSDHGCTPTAAEKACYQGGPTVIQPGLDGSCQQLCPNGAWGFQANQCCPDGTLPGPDGKCNKPQQPGCPPAQLSSTGFCCPPGSKPQPDGSCYPKKLKQCPPDQLSSNGTCCPSGTKPQPDGSCGQQQTSCPPSQLTASGLCCPTGTPAEVTAAGLCCVLGTPAPPNGVCSPSHGSFQVCASELPTATGGCCPSGTTVNAATGQCCPAQPSAVGVVACSCPPGQTMVDGKCEFAAPPSKPSTSVTGPNECFAGYVPLPNGSCCLASQATEGGQCCPAGQKPDADKRKCVPAGGGATFVPGLKHVPVPIIIPHGKDSGREAVPPTPSRPIVIPPPKRGGAPKLLVPPKRFAPGPIIRRPGVVGGPVFRRQLER